MRRYMPPQTLDTPVALPFLRLAFGFMSIRQAALLGKRPPCKTFHSALYALQCMSAHLRRMFFASCFLRDMNSRRYIGLRSGLSFVSLSNRAYAMRV